MAFPFFKPRPKSLTAVAGAQIDRGVEAPVEPEQVVIFVDGENLVDIIRTLRGAAAPEV